MWGPATVAWGQLGARAEKGLSSQGDPPGGGRYLAWQDRWVWAEQQRDQEGNPHEITSVEDRESPRKLWTLIWGQTVGTGGRVSSSDEPLRQGKASASSIMCALSLSPTHTHTNTHTHACTSVCTSRRPPLISHLSHMPPCSPVGWEEGRRWTSQLSTCLPHHPRPPPEGQLKDLWRQPFADLLFWASLHGRSACPCL